jgi:hypothetical protein
MAMIAMQEVTMADLEAGLEGIRQSPKEMGVLELIVRRPQTEQREVLTQGHLDQVDGLVGDNWRTRGSSRTADGSAHPDMQLTLMNSRVITLIAGEKERWPLAGDQLFVDFDLSADNLPPGTRLALGSAVVEVTAEPHTGCKKFMARFGQDALKFISSPMGRALQMRGINTKVVQPGQIRVGDSVRKISG